MAGLISCVIFLPLRRQVVAEMQLAVRDAQSKFENDIRQERQSASDDRETLLLDYHRQVEETKKSDAAVSKLEQRLDAQNHQVGRKDCHQHHCPSQKLCHNTADASETRHWKILQ